MPNAPRSDSLSGLARVAIAATTWGTIPVFVRMVHANAAVIVFWRVIMAASVALVVLLARKQFGVWKTLALRRRFAILSMGCLLAVNWALYLGALQLTKVSVAVLLAYCGPVFVAVMTPVIAREPFDRRLLLPLALALGGVVAIVGPQDLSLTSGTELLGAAMALASAFTYAMLVLNAKRLIHGVPTSVYMLGEYVGAALLLLPAVLLFDGPSQPVEWAGLAGLGILNTAITGMIFLSGLRLVRADHAAMLTYAEPVSAVLFSALLLAEPITAMTVLGGGLVVAGGVLVARMEPQQGIETPGFVSDEPS
ncbi:MAG: DMT family transporter [Coriobacteriia bacterium]